MCAHIIFRQIVPSLHQQCHRAVLVHNIHIRNGRITMLFRHLIVHGCICPGTSIGGIAFHNGSLQSLHQLTDQICPEVVAARLTGRELYGNFAGEPAFDLLKNFLPARDAVLYNRLRLIR